MTVMEHPRDLPKVDDVLRDAGLRDALATHGHVLVRDAVRRALDDARRQLLEHDDAPLEDASIYQAVLDRLEQWQRQGIRPVINATGAILHTNLGRAPLADHAIDAVVTVACGYSTLEFDLEERRRGFRTTAVESLLVRLLDVEAALVVNNNAAAVMLALSALGRGREVIVSRGELVEIGGAFRIPEIMEESQAVLHEVGTTNKTRLRDYERAIGEDTAALLKVHQSNFKIEGFTEDVSAGDLADLAHAHDLPLLYDLGSGLLSSALAEKIPTEPTVRQAVDSGADIICFSGDKLLGGPQAGIIIGRRDCIDIMRSHPLLRAFRCDKMTIAALEATLRLYMDPDRSIQRIPLLAMALTDLDDLYQRTEAIAETLASNGVPVTAEPSKMILGGGSAPEQTLPSWALVIRSDTLSPNDAADRLARHDPPIVGRTASDALWLDLRTVSTEDEADLIAALIEVFSEEAPV